MSDDATARLLRDAAERSIAYLDGLAERRVMPDEAAAAGLAAFDEPFPDSPCEPGETLELLDRAGSPATVASAGGRYFGFVQGGVLPAALAAHVLAGAWDQNAGLSLMSPVASRLHAVVSRWLVEAFGLPREATAMFVSGATTANLCGLIAGRDHVLREAGWDAAADGLIGAPPITVVAGEGAHITIGKSASIAGLGRKRIVIVPADDQGRMRPERLPNIDGPVVLCAQAGEVNTGAFDPFEPLIDWARERNCWVHIDGAIALWAAASPSRRHLTRGIERADSWTTDGHKWLNVPYDCGIVLVRNVAALRPSMSARAEYLPDTGLDPMHHTPQSSQRARAIEVWAALRTLGRAGLAELIDRCSDHARRFADALRAAGCEVLNDVVINQVLVRFGDDGNTERVMRRVQQSNVCWCGGTLWQGRRAMRISVSSWATTAQDVDRSIAAILAAR